MGTRMSMAVNVLAFGLAAAALLALTGCGGGGSGVSRGVSIVPPTSAVTHQLDACVGKPSPPTAVDRVSFNGLVTAHRPVSSVMVRGYARVGSFTYTVTTVDLGSMSSGQTRAFRFSGFIPLSTGEFSCGVESWAR